MFDFFSRIAFLIGFFIGFVFVFFKINSSQNLKPVPMQGKFQSFETNYSIWLKSNNLFRKPVSVDELRYGFQKYVIESEHLYKEVKVLCIILVRKFVNRDASNSTWTQSCNEVMFANLTSSLYNKKKPLKKTKQNSSWAILCRTLLTFPKNITFNWILVVHDDTFAIIENLRYLVASLDDKKYYYLGHGISFWGTNYNSGEAGYVLSRGTFLKLKKYLNGTQSCFKGNTLMNQEDYYLGKILYGQGIQPSDTRDSSGLSTFHGFNLQKLFFPGSTVLSNYYKTSLYPVKCCSPYSITFKASDGDKMYTYHYLLYHVQLFYEGNLGNKPAPTPVPEKEVWQSFLRNQSIFVENISAEEYYKVWEGLVNDPKVFVRQMRKHRKSNED